MSRKSPALKGCSVGSANLLFAIRTLSYVVGLQNFKTNIPFFQSHIFMALFFQENSLDFTRVFQMQKKLARLIIKSVFMVLAEKFKNLKILSFPPPYIHKFLVFVCLNIYKFVQQKP